MMRYFYTNNSAIVMAVLTLCFITFAVETDIYVPAFPQMLHALRVTENQIQAVISVNFLGLCLGSLFFGPLSDAYGRRAILLLGLSIFSAASLGSVLVGDFMQLVVLRFIQGIGAGSILAVSSAAIFDRYNAAKSAQMLSALNSVVTMAVGLAPVLGSSLTAALGWRSVFSAVLILGLVSLITTFLFLEESLHKEKRQRFGLRLVMATYLVLLYNRKYLVKTLIWTLMASVIFIYTANISIIFVERLGMSLDSFGIYQSLTIGTFSVFSLFASALIGRFGVDSIKAFGACSFIVGSFVFFAVGIYLPENVTAIAGVMAFIAMSCALAMVSFFAESVEGIENSGAAVALAMGVRLALLYFLVDLSRVFFSGSVLSVASIIFVVALLVLMLLIADYRRTQLACAR